MISEEETSALRQVQESSDEELQAWWSGFGIEDIGDNILKDDSWSEWYRLVVSELIYRGFCFQKKNGIECADHGVSVADMCPGCKMYWIKAAWLAGKTTEEWIAECAA
jgi:hypothetical protein